MLVPLALLGAASPALVRSEEPEAAPLTGSDMSFLDHARPGPIWFGGEVNSIFQYHPAFSAPYTGPHSLRPESETALSGLLTVFFAYTPFRTTTLIPRSRDGAGGGLSESVGAAGFPNLDVVRNPTLSHAPYIARAEIHQIIPLSDVVGGSRTRTAVRSAQPLVPRHRLEFRLGKMSTADFFDINPAGSDSHLQFMNWSVDNNGAFDYAADTRGYTYGLVAEYQGPRIEARVGEMLMPKVANGLDLDFDITLKPRREPGARDRSNCSGRIGEAPCASSATRTTRTWAATVKRLNAFLNNVDAQPDITLHRRQGRVKRGVGANVVQELLGVARAFARLGWSTGDLESFAYTEIEKTIQEVLICWACTGDVPRTEPGLRSSATGSPTCTASI